MKCKCKLKRQKKYSNNNENFSERKMKQFGNPPVQLTPISEQFFHGPSLCPNGKKKTPPLPPPLILGEETM